MRLVSLLALASAWAVPAQAQVRVAASVGLDGAYEVPMAGLAVEVGVGRLPVAVRPSAEFVFATAFVEDVSETPVVRVALDAVARINAADVPNTPYVVLGVEAERQRRGAFSGPARAALDTETDRVGLGVRAGAGLRLGRLAAEATLGVGEAGRGRLVVGVRF